MSGKLELPPITQQPVQHIDGTPDREYPLRILRAYRANCDCRFECQGLDEAATRIYELMNEHCEQRAALLDEAIAILALEAQD